MADKNIERQETVRLEDYVRIARERAWIIVLSIAVVAVIALYMSYTTTPLYSTSARLVYQKNDLELAVSGIGLNVYDYDKDRSIATAVAAIKNSETMAEAVKTALDTELQPSTLRGMVSVSVGEGSDLVDISAVSTDAQEAAKVANAYALEFIIYRQNADRATVAAASAVVKTQLDSLSQEDLQGDYGLILREKLETLRILEAMQDGRFTLMREAAVPGSPYTPQTKRNLILAVVVGLVLGIGLAFLVEYLDKRIKDEKSLERASGLPVLASIPAVGGKWKSAKKGERSAEVIGFEGSSSVLLESFRTLRSSLQYFETDEGPRTLLITSGLPQEGKTVTTVNLAISLALSGQRAIVLEADLRKPMIHKYLNLDNKVGLSSVLSGQSSIAGAMQLVLMEDFLPESARKAHGENIDTGILRKNLYCVTSGPLPPNPAELLASTRMANVIKELKQLCDFLLIDTPPVLPVSDALTLATEADAVIVTARLHSSTREEMGEVRNLIDRAGIRVIGVVAGGVKTSRGYYNKRGYNYGYGYQ
jgi:capsular exopolysaccharide synthesis family protein